jgi:hypothetical protein
MDNREKQKIRNNLALTVFKAHEAYIQACSTAKSFGLNVRNSQCITYDYRKNSRQILVNGKLINEVNDDTKTD